jgi:hypothetical protein
MRDHRLIDERSLAFGRAIATRLPEHPEFVEHARGTLGRWMGTASSRVQPVLDEWLGILNGPFEGVISVLTSTDERTTRLRQSNPFAGLLSQTERNAILQQFEVYDAAST